MMLETRRFLGPLLRVVFFTNWALSAREAPTVTLPGQGALMGFHKTMLRTQKVGAYLGVPYAQPPLGPLRFAPPRTDELPSWEGVRNATLPAPDCMQGGMFGVNALNPLPAHDEMFAKVLEAQLEEPLEKVYSEDCLYLNVFLPDGGFIPAEGYATMVWFHSGDFVRGSPHDVDFFQLVFKQKVIVVTVAYRLNIFGFFGTLDSAAPGNYGLMDQSAALMWVQNNINLFGGNKENICIFGQGSGAISVGLHLTSEYSAGLFHKAIAMSGNVLAPDTVKDPKKESPSVDKVASAFSCFRRPTEDLLGCLRRVPFQGLLDIGQPLAEWKPIVDKDLSNDTLPFVSDFPSNMFNQLLFQKVPLLTGFTDMEDALRLSKEDTEDSGISQNEFNFMVNEIITSDITVRNNTCFKNQQIIFDAVSFFYSTVPPTTNETVLREQFLDFYTEKVHGSTTYKMAKVMSPHVPVFCYRFDLKPASEAVNQGIPSWVGVAHNFDLTFVLGLPYLSLPKNYPKWDNSDKRISDIIMKLWANFAQYSNPTNSGVYINWEPFKPESPGFLIIDRNFNMSNPENLNYKAFEFWNDFYPRVIEFGTKCAEQSDADNDLAASVIVPHKLLVWCIMLQYVCLLIK